VTAAVTYMTTQEQFDGKAAEFVEQISNDQYPD
jgi:hypothetical protein